MHANVWQRADPAHLIEFLVAVKQTNLDNLQETLLNGIRVCLRASMRVYMHAHASSVSDPASPSYANFLSQRAVHDLIAPARQSVRVHACQHGRPHVCVDAYRWMPLCDGLKSTVYCGIACLH